MRAAVMAAAIVMMAGAARAEVLDAQPGGFEIRHVAQVAAAPDKVWAALVDVGGWWASSHTYSGDAGNLSLDPRAGGCWCEGLPGGSVEHLRAVYVDEGKALRLAGALGPLQTTGGTGHLTFALAPKDGGTALTVTYAFGGYRREGMASLAGPVDGVFTQQLARLKALAEGRPPA